jgi:hypothetical protein
VRHRANHHVAKVVPESSLAGMSETNTPVQTEQTTQTQNNKPDVATLDERAYQELVQKLSTAVEQPKAEEAPVATEPAPEPEPKAEDQTKAEANLEEVKPDEVKDEIPDPQANILPERVRVGSWSEEERKALQIRARNPDLSLAQAMEMVKKGESEQAVQYADPATLESKLSERAKAKAEAIRSLEFDKAADLELEIQNLNLELRRSERRAAEDASKAQTEYTQRVSEAKSKAVKFYPDASDRNSPLVAKMNEIYESLKDTQNPLVSDPELPWKLTQMAANAIGIAPNSGRPAPSSSVARQNKPPIASGNARTTAPATISPKDLIAKIDDLDTLQALAARL